VHFNLILGLVLICSSLPSSTFANELMLSDVKSFVAGIEQKQKKSTNFRDANYTIIDDKQSSGMKIYVFVSDSVPDESLRKMAIDADRIGEPLTIRGFINDSIKDTTIRASELFEGIGAGEFSVDPEAFSDFKINSAPAVLISGGDDMENYDVVYGNIPLKDSLEIISREGKKQNAEFACKLIELGKF
jgi:type-F conjugative transfer system pilin assembly protein TrbC